MAGLGFKDFQVGEVLTSSDVDGYLMQQTVMRFADSAARGSALGTAAGTGVALAEGMVTYLDDVNQVQVYNGTGWTAPGKISQVVQSVKTDTFSTSSTSFVDITDLEVTITPASNTSVMLVLLQVQGSGSSSIHGHYRLIRDGNAIYVGDAVSDRTQTLGEFGISSDFMVPGAGIYLDSPATSSAVTYKAQLRASSGTTYLNRSSTDTNSAVFGRGASSLTVIEVAA